MSLPSPGQKILGQAINNAEHLANSMIEKPRLVLLVALVSFAGIIGIYGYALSIEPTPTSIHDISSEQVGTMVLVEGTVRSTRAAWDGGMLLELWEPGAQGSLEVHLTMAGMEDARNLNKLLNGTVVRVQGMLDLYNGEYELIVTSYQDLEIISTTDSSLVPISTLLELPEVYEGAPVRLAGEVGFVQGSDYFTMRESVGNYTYTLTVRTSFDQTLRDVNGFPVLSYDRVEVRGELDYNPTRGRWELLVEGAGQIRKLSG